MLLLHLLIGGGAGALIGYFGRCSSGTCPLTASWRRGAFFGAAMGLMLYLMSGGTSSAAMNASSANVQRISPDQFDAQVTQSKTPVLVDFYATWCGPCRALSPVVDRLGGQFVGRVKFVKINLDEAAALARRFDIQAIPTLLLFQDGKLVDHLVGFQDADMLQRRLEALAGTNPPPANLTSR